MAQPINRVTQRNHSTLGIPSISRSASLSPSNGTSFSTPQSSKSSAFQPDRRHTGLRSLFTKFREPAVSFELLTPPSSPPIPPSPPVISKLAKAFVDSMNATQLSNFLVWMLYYDTVELPDSPENWYKKIDHMEMRGWVALGSYLFDALEAGQGYGFDLVVLDSICDRIRLQRSTVHEFLARFADPEKMKYSILASTVQTAQQDDASTLKVLDTIQSKLHELNKLATNLKPQQNSQYEEWLAALQTRIRAFSHLVIGPRIAHVRTGKPLCTAATCDQLPPEIKDAIKLNYAYEALQQERIVPLTRYNIYNHTSTTNHSITGSSDSPRNSNASPDEETERARNHAIHLMVQNTELRTQLSTMKSAYDKLVDANEKLARRIVGLRGGAALPSVTTTSVSNRDNDDDDDDEIRQHLQTLHISHPEQSPLPEHTHSKHPRPRSLTHPTPEPSTTHTRQHSDILAHKYKDVFSGLLGDEDPVVSASTSAYSSEDASTIEDACAPNRGRRSGMIFPKGNVVPGLVVGVGVGSGEEDEEGGGGDGFVPLSASRGAVSGGDFALLG